MPDETITCSDCKDPFIYTEGEQAFFVQKGFQKPRRCKGCRVARREKGKDPNPMKE